VEILKTREAGEQFKIPGNNVDSFIPFNPSIKKTEAKVTKLSTGKRFRCIKGAPHIIVEICGGHKEGNESVVDLANRGLRALGVARTNDAALVKFELIGMVSLLESINPHFVIFSTLLKSFDLWLAIKRLFRSWRMFPSLILSDKKKWMEVNKPATIISSSEEPASFSSAGLLFIN
jgi:hypothetical protein